MQDMLLVMKKFPQRKEKNYKQEKQVFKNCFKIIFIDYRVQDFEHFTHRKSTRCINLVYYLFKLPGTLHST